MKKLFCVVAIIATIACSNAQKKEFDQESLAIQLRTQQNTKISFGDILKKHSGKVTVIEIWASWCGDCVKAMPLVKEMQANNPKVDYVFISMDKEFEKWMLGIKTHELNGDHYWAPEGMKGEFGKSIDLDWIPRYIVIGKKGEMVIYRAIETDFGRINQQLKELTAGEVKSQSAELIKN